MRCDSVMEVLFHLHWMSTSSLVADHRVFTAGLTHRLCDSNPYKIDTQPAGMSTLDGSPGLDYCHNRDHGRWGSASATLKRSREGGWVKNQQDILGQLLEPKCRYKLALIWRDSSPSLPTHKTALHIKCNCNRAFDDSVLPFFFPLMRCDSVMEVLFHLHWTSTSSLVADHRVFTAGLTPRLCDSNPNALLPTH